MIKIFHHDDLDGYSAAYLVDKYYSQFGNKSEFIPINYNMEFPLDSIKENDLVFIVDYSIHPADMIKLLRKTSEVVWIDHHISSIELYEEYQDLIEDVNSGKDVRGFRLNGLCGAALVYLYLFERYREEAQLELKTCTTDLTKFYTTEFKIRAPFWLQVVNSWDVWTHDFDQDEFLQIATASNLSIELIKNIDTKMNFFSDLVTKGKTYVEYRDIWSKEFMRRYGFECTLIDSQDKQLSAFVANLGNANSKFFGDLIDKHDVVTTMCFNGVDWNYSIYSNKEEVDCAKIAQSFRWRRTQRSCRFQT